MRKIKGKKLLILMVFMLIFTGCGKQEETVETKENTVVLETETEPEQVETESETEPETEEKETEEIVETELQTEQESESVEVETETETEEMTVEEKEKIEYTVTQVEEVSMYAASSVNVRQGPSTDFERVGALKAGQEVKVTGEASTGWYEIAYGEEKAYVSNKYLQSEPIPVPVPVQQPEAASSNNAGVPVATNVVLIGDSRTAEMKNCVGENSCVWIAEHSKGIKWFVSDAVPTADPYITQGTKVIINLGANDPEKIDTYIYTISEVAANWTGRGATVYYATVGPCHENPYHTNDEAVNFNAALQNGVSGVHWIDLYSYMVNNGFATREGDGFHYDTPTYAGIYSYYMSCIN
ncbi:MAG: SGNH/GDSL hydrolase family protein [Lachnospiraceae bacterium]|nr:SGNH/GDSL hydrolase family protein [Lachnospiraceae bacterium]